MPNPAETNPRKLTTSLAVLSAAIAVLSVGSELHQVALDNRQAYAVSHPGAPSNTEIFSVTPETHDAHNDFIAAVVGGAGGIALAGAFTARTIYLNSRKPKQDK
jgi:hypothetical protein